MNWIAQILIALYIYLQATLIDRFLSQSAGVIVGGAYIVSCCAFSPQELILAGVNLGSLSPKSNNIDLISLLR